MRGVGGCGGGARVACEVCARRAQGLQPGCSRLAAALQPGCSLMAVHLLFDDLRVGEGLRLEAELEPLPRQLVHTAPVGSELLRVRVGVRVGVALARTGRREGRVKRLGLGFGLGLAS